MIRLLNSFFLGLVRHEEFDGFFGFNFGVEGSGDEYTRCHATGNDGQTSELRAVLLYDGLNLVKHDVPFQGIGEYGYLSPAMNRSSKSGCSLVNVMSAKAWNMTDAM